MLTILVGVLMIILGTILTFVGNFSQFALSSFGLCLVFFLYFGGLGAIILGAKPSGKY
jgi:hypothetical protein